MYKRTNHEEKVNNKMKICITKRKSQKEWIMLCKKVVKVFEAQGDAKNEQCRGKKL
jgi:hypothetical protein